MIGYLFNGCEVVKRSGTSKDKRALWECKCQCGNLFVVSGKSIRSENTKSCGCLRTKSAVKTGKRNTTHGETGTRLYDIWRSMKRRCNNPQASSYEYYGGKGINVCKSWEEDYKVFRDWSLSNGYKEDLTIDRIDNAGNYCPSNCRWVDVLTQNRNRSISITVEYDGEATTLTEISEKTGIPYQTLYAKYKEGLIEPVKEASK